MPLYTCFLHNLLNVLVQIANEMRLQKKTSHPQFLRRPVKRGLYAEPPCTLASSQSQPRQAEHSQAVERVAGGGLQGKWLRISIVSARLYGRVSVSSSLQCRRARRETARACVWMCRADSWLPSQSFRPNDILSPLIFLREIIL
jgi:hypothetical protein